MVFNWNKRLTFDLCFSVHVKFISGERTLKMYPGHGNPMGSMPNPSTGDMMRGQYHVHQQHQHQYHQPPPQQQQSQYHQQQQHHHHPHQLLPGQTVHGHVSGHGQHVHGHSSRHPHGHAHERHRDDRREASHRHGINLGFAMATEGESPYGGVQQQMHGGFVMGTDLRTTTPTSGGWYHEQPGIQVQPVMMTSSVVNVPHAQPESTTPKDPGQTFNRLC